MVGAKQQVAHADDEVVGDRGAAAAKGKLLTVAADDAVDLTPVAQRHLHHHVRHRNGIALDSDGLAVHAFRAMHHVSAHQRGALHEVDAARYRRASLRQHGPQRHRSRRPERPLPDDGVFGVGSGVNAEERRLQLVPEHRPRPQRQEENQETADGGLHPGPSNIEVNTPWDEGHPVFAGAHRHLREYRHSASMVRHGGQEAFRPRAGIGSRAAARHGNCT